MRRSFSSDGGCLFPVRPALSAADTVIFWMPKDDTSTVLLTAAPAFLPVDSNLSAALHPRDTRADEQGEHFRHDLGDGRFLHLLRLAGISADRPVAIIIPLDADGFDRIEAAMRLLRALHGRAIPTDARMTRQQLRRARHMLQAADGRMNGASYREIAGAIFGTARVADEPWKTSALRDATMDLVKDAFAMIAGGYRTLLRHRRRS